MNEPLPENKRRLSNKELLRHNNLKQAIMRNYQSTSEGTEQLNRIYVRDNGICQVCQLPCSRRNASRGHIKALSTFMLTELAEAWADENLQLEHQTCNRRKGVN